MSTTTSRSASLRGGGHRALVAAVAALVVAGTVLLALALSRQVGAPPSPDAGSPAGVATVAPRGPADPASPTAPAGRDGPAGAAARAAQPPSATATAPRPAATGAGGVAPLPASAPVRVRVPALGVDTAPIDVGLTAEGAMQVPERGEDVGWFTPSPTPGEVGPTVLAGHVTRASQPAVFFALGGLRPGDRVEVVREDGRTVVYEVTAVEQHPKDAFPTLRVYGNTPDPQLRLITCGGEVDSATGHHDDNVVVFAAAVDVLAG